MGTGVWSRQEDLFLKKNAKKQSTKQIANELGRTVSAVHNRAYLLHVSLNSGSRKYSITQAEKVCPDMVKGQTWRGSQEEYSFNCNKHGTYVQTFNQHQQGEGCSVCGGRITRDIAEKYFPEMAKGQNWRGTQRKYWFVCD